MLAGSSVLNFTDYCNAIVLKIWPNFSGSSSSSCPACLARSAFSGKATSTLHHEAHLFNKEVEQLESICTEISLLRSPGLLMSRDVGYSCKIMQDNIYNYTVKKRYWCDYYCISLPSHCLHNTQYQCVCVCVCNRKRDRSFKHYTCWIGEFDILNTEWDVIMLLCVFSFCSECLKWDLSSAVLVMQLCIPPP